MAWNVGEKVRLKVTVKDADGDVIDPSTVRVDILLPDSTNIYKEYPGDVINDGTGVYYYDYLVTMSGGHIYKWSTTGSPTLVEEGKFSVMVESV